MDKPLNSLVLSFDEIKERADNANHGSFKVETEPSSVEVGVPFTLKLYATYQHSLHDPRFRIIGSKKTEVEGKEVEQIVSLPNPNLAYAIDRIVSVSVANALVDVSTKQIKYVSGEEVSGALSIVNNKLQIKEGQPDLYGSIKIKYKTLPAQMWDIEAFEFIGAAAYFFTNLSTLNEKIHVVNVIEKSAYSGSTSVSFAPHHELAKGAYHSFRMYFNDNFDFDVFTTYGRLEPQGVRTGNIYNETVELNGELVVAAKHYITGRIDDGYSTYHFYDAKGNSTDCGVSISDGKIHLSKQVWGAITFAYKAKYYLYDYFSQRPRVNGKRSTTLGKVSVYSRELIGTYDIPAQELVSSEARSVIILYSEYLIGDNKRFELPPDYPKENTFPHHPTDNEDDLPPKGEEIHKQERAHIIYDLFGSSLFETSDPVWWNSPIGVGEKNEDVKMLIKAEYPEDATHEQKELIKEKYDELKEEYNIA